MLLLRIGSERERIAQESSMYRLALIGLILSEGSLRNFDLEKKASELLMSCLDSFLLDTFLIHQLEIILPERVLLTSPSTQLASISIW